MAESLIFRAFNKRGGSNLLLTFRLLYLLLEVNWERRVEKANRPGTARQVNAHDADNGNLEQREDRMLRRKSRYCSIQQPRNQTSHL